MNEHIAFLQSLIMNTKLIDKKYSDGVPSCVSLIDVHDHSADDGIHGTEKVKTRRSSKKMKPSRDGLYPMEDSLIRKYWANLDDEIESGVPGASREERTKTRIAQLRVRETQLQIIVILEVLALHPLVSTTENLGADLPAAFPVGANADGKERAVKSKMPDNLATLIDVHIDRLCIWQDIAAEATNSAHGGPQSGSASGSGSSNLPKHTDNILRDFCVEVIGPL
jgi:DNA replication regulator SLD3